MIKTVLNKLHGTTLIEIIIYFAMIAIVLFAAMSFTIQIFNVSRVSTNSHEVQSSLGFITDKITSTIQRADSINDAASIFDNDRGALSLNMQSGPSPITFSITDGNVTFKEGTSQAIQLNSGFTTVSIFRFGKISYPKAPDQVTIDITMNETDLAHLSVTLRK